MPGSKPNRGAPAASCSRDSKRRTPASTPTISCARCSSGWRPGAGKGRPQWCSASYRSWSRTAEKTNPSRRTSVERAAMPRTSDVQARALRAGLRSLRSLRPARNAEGTQRRVAFNLWGASRRGKRTHPRGRDLVVQAWHRHGPGHERRGHHVRPLRLVAPHGR